MLLDVPETGTGDVFSVFVLVPSTFLIEVEVETMTTDDVSSVFVTELEVVPEITPVEVGSLETEVEVDAVSTFVVVVPTGELDPVVRAISLLLVEADALGVPVLVDIAGDVEVPLTLRFETDSELEAVVADGLSFVDVAVPEAALAITSEDDAVLLDMVLSTMDVEARDVAGLEAVAALEDVMTSDVDCGNKLVPSTDLVDSADVSVAFTDIVDSDDEVD